MAKRPRRRRPEFTLTNGDIELISFADASVTVVINGLAHFLEEEGLIEHAAFIEYLDRVVDEIEETVDPLFAFMIRAQIRSMRMEPEEEEPANENEPEEKPP